MAVDKVYSVGFNSVVVRLWTLGSDPKCEACEDDRGSFVTASQLVMWTAFGVGNVFSLPCPWEKFGWMLSDPRRETTWVSLDDLHTL